MPLRVSSQDFLVNTDEKEYTKQQTVQNSNESDSLCFGGYEEFFVDDIPNDLKCPVCFLVLRHPVQIEECGHRFCESCFNRLEKNKGTLLCPLDRQVVDVEKIFLDKAAKRAILSFSVKCRNFKRECDWVGDLRSIDNHLTSCPFVEVVCPNECKIFVMRKDLTRHLELSCEYRIIECRYCWKKSTFSEFQIHIEKCFERPIECVNKCGVKDILRAKMNEHVENHCPLTLKPCEYMTVGCVFKGTDDQRENHKNLSTSFHLSLAVDKIHSLEKIVSHHEETINKLKYHLDSMINSKEFLERSVSAAERRVCDLERDVFTLENKSGLLTTVPLNNVFIWAIDNISSRVAKEQKSTKELDTCSSPFYSAPFGYKLFLQIYLNGHGKQRGKNISLFLHIMKGEYDNLLDWPFTKSIKLTLLDQSKNRKHKTFDIDPYKSDLDYFQKPVLRSKRVGCIIPHNVFEPGFIMDNKLLIKCEVQP